MTMINTPLFLVVALLSTSAMADDSKSLRYGRDVSQRYCASCHGHAGDGFGTSARRFDNTATDFGRGIYKCRTTPTGTLPTDDDLRRSVRDGLFDSGMPAFVAIGMLQIDDVITLIKSFSARFAHERPGMALSVPMQPASTAESIAHGAQVYETMKCANCHGPRGRGRGPAAATLRNEDGSEAHVTDLAGSLKCGDSPTRIYTTIMTGMDGTPMSSYAETLEAKDAWALVHFVQSLRR